MDYDAVRTGSPDSIESIMELPLLLSRQQINKLAAAAQRQGLTSAQYLRKLISSLCESEVKTA